MPKKSKDSRKPGGKKSAHQRRRARGAEAREVREFGRRGRVAPARAFRETPRHYRGYPKLWARLKQQGAVGKRAPRCDVEMKRWRTTGVVPPVRCWLGANPAIRERIVWQSEVGDVAFDNWTEDQRLELYTAFDLVRRGLNVVTDDPPPNMQLLGDNDFPVTVLDRAHAWDLYLSLVANSLHVEIARLVSWSMLDYAPDVSEKLLTSRNLFSYRADYGGYVVWPDHGWTLPAPAEKAWAFLQANSLIGVTAEETVANVVEWCRQHLRHYSGGHTAINFQNTWGYRGFPPTSGFFTGANRFDTAGCHGTNGFLQDVLRAVNIPVDYQVIGWNVAHATPSFPSLDLYLSHGDDPYNMLALGNPDAPYPASALLVDQATYDAWFDVSVGPAMDLNVGRQVKELALIYLPLKLLRDYCVDQAQGRSHETGTVAQYFSDWYSVADLESIDLWGRLDAKIASLGGCGALPQLT